MAGPSPLNPIPDDSISFSSIVWLCGDVDTKQIVSQNEIEGGKDYKLLLKRDGPSPAGAMRAAPKGLRICCRQLREGNALVSPWKPGK